MNRLTRKCGSKTIKVCSLSTKSLISVRKGEAGSIQTKTWTFKNIVGEGTSKLVFRISYCSCYSKLRVRVFLYHLHLKFLKHLIDEVLSFFSLGYVRDGKNFTIHVYDVRLHLRTTLSSRQVNLWINGFSFCVVYI